MPAPSYLPHILYSTALTSVSIHLLFQRKAAEEDLARHNAQITILEDLAHQLRSGGEAAQSHSAGEIGWMDVIWGRKAVDETTAKIDWERKDLEQLSRELSKGSR
ncbi:hypothetical protein BU15DRAFT_86588 [Melanogaster broomeanus]|nr:hypothetical protein BU15DRAFT_86588 [Melanogaster broomeanus]